MRVLGRDRDAHVRARSGSGTDFHRALSRAVRLAADGERTRLDRRALRRFAIELWSVVLTALMFRRSRFLSGLP